MMMMEHKDDHLPSPLSSASSSSFDSNGGTSMTTSEGLYDLTDDASSFSSSQSTSPLYGLYSDLINHLPMFKRGLSKHFNAKSQSFTCLSKVISVDDLVKKERFCTRPVKACKSIGAAGLEYKRPITSPKPAIFKKSSRSTHLSFVCHPLHRSSQN